MQEIMVRRPYKNLEDLLWDDKGKWKHSKVNKTCFTSLCKIEAFGSLEEIKSGEISNHKQLLAIITDDKNYDLLKKGQYGMTKTQAKRAEKNGEMLEPILDRLRSDYSRLPDWNRTEKILNYIDLTSGVSNNLVFPDEFVKRIESKNVDSVFEVPSRQRGVGWFCVTDVIQKLTKNNKPFYRFKIMDLDNNTGWLRVWGSFSTPPERYTLWMADVSNDPNWGMSTSSAKVRKITAFE
jgi:DNA polymerase III alpha subunit